MIRLWKLARLLKLGKFMKNVEDYVTISPAAGTIRMIKLLLQVTLIAHMFACIWFQMSAVDTFSFDGRTEDQSKWWTAVGIWNGDLAPGASQEINISGTGRKVCRFHLLGFYNHDYSWLWGCDASTSLRNCFLHNKWY